MPKQLELPLEIVETAKSALSILSRIYELKEEYEAIRSEINELIEQHGIKELKKRLSAIRNEVQEAEAEYRIETRNAFVQMIGDVAQEG
jgi:DNA repair exonuclease SbcCD ATPase subunit